MTAAAETDAWVENFGQSMEWREYAALPEASHRNDHTIVLNPMNPFVNPKIYAWIQRYVRPLSQEGRHAQVFASHGDI